MKEKTAQDNEIEGIESTIKFFKQRLEFSQMEKQIIQEQLQNMNKKISNYESILKFEEERLKELKNMDANEYLEFDSQRCDFTNEDFGMSYDEVEKYIEMYGDDKIFGEVIIYTLNKLYTDIKNKEMKNSKD